jgi:hypothetical protein
MEDHILKLIHENINHFGEPLEIVSGGAVGVDTHARKYSKTNLIAFKEFKPDYNKHGSYAPLIRNSEIANYSDACLAIKDSGAQSKSKGTEDCINKFRNKGKDVLLITVRTTM